MDLCIKPKKHPNFYTGRVSSKERKGRIKMFRIDKMNSFSEIKKLRIKFKKWSGKPILHGDNLSIGSFQALHLFYAVFSDNQ